MSKGKKQPRATRTVKRSKRELFLEDVRRQAVVDHINAEVAKGGRNHDRDIARDLLRKELAAWLMAMRLRVSHLYDEILGMRSALLGDGNLLQGLIEGEAMAHLGEANRCLEGAVNAIELVTVDCPQPAVLRIAEGYQKNWNV